MSKKTVKQPNAVAPSNLKINTASETEQKKLSSSVEEVRTLIEYLYLDVKVRSPSEVRSRQASDRFRFKS
jgi:hypothetical protein